MTTKDPKLTEALALLDRGDWQKAHVIVQSLETPSAAWVHGIVHLMEGDEENARYWYGRAKRTYPSDIEAELAAASASLCPAPARGP